MIMYQVSLSLLSKPTNPVHTAIETSMSIVPSGSLLLKPSSIGQHVPMPRSIETDKHYAIQASSSKELFKDLLIGTKLGTALKQMTLSKAVLDGLKPQECEQGSGQNKLTIPYIPEKDKL